MSELRARARVFYNALNFDKPVNFGQEELVPKGLGEDKYVDSLHGAADHDPVQELANQIDLCDSAGARSTGIWLDRGPGQRSRRSLTISHRCANIICGQSLGRVQPTKSAAAVFSL